MTRTTGVAAVAAVLLMTSGCGGDDGTGADQSVSAPETASTGCEDAFATAAEVDEPQESQEALWVAFTACADLEEFTAAAEQHPDALDGADPETYVTTECRDEPAVGGTPVCDDVSVP